MKSANNALKSTKANNNNSKKSTKANSKKSCRKKPFSIENDKNLKLIQRFNKCLTGILLLFLCVLGFSYYLVTEKERDVVSIHNQANKLNFANLKLENNLDQSKSFYNIKKKASKINFLKNPDKVLEIKARTKIVKFNKNLVRKKLKTVPGY